MKKYEKPLMRQVDIDIKDALLCGSLNANNVKGNCTQLGKDFDDDWDME